MIVNHLVDKPVWTPINLQQVNDLRYTAVIRLSIKENQQYLAKVNSVLIPEEQNRASQFRLNDDRLRFILGRSAIREILGFHTNLHPSKVPLSYNAYGKPTLPQGTRQNLHFNISHSGNYILIALSNLRVGIDTEQLVPTLAYEEIMSVVLSNAEANFMQQAPYSSRERFYLLWTRKEAFLKNIGCGLAFPAKGIPALNGSHPIAFDPQKSYETCSFYYANDYVGSICGEQNPSSIHFYHLSLT